MRQCFTFTFSQQKTVKLSGIFFSLVLSLLMTGGLFAATDEQEKQDMLNMRNAVEQVKRDTNGKILSVRSVKTGKVKFYRVKVLTRAGRVHVVQIPSIATKLSAQAQIKAPETVKKDQ